MTIQEYLIDTTTQIVEAICAIDKEITPKGAFIAATGLEEINPNTTNSLIGAVDNDGEMHLVAKIEFDIATTISESNETKGGAGLKVNVLNLGIGAKNEAQTQTLNRVKFSIPLAIPFSEQSKSK